MRKKIFYNCFLYFLLIGTQAIAQLNASFFVSDIQGQPTNAGCSPLIVRMNNTSTGTNPGTTWFWDSGIMANSTLQNPVFGYSNPGTFTVTLIATNAGVSDTFQQNVTVLPNPQVNFGATFLSGCEGFNTCFIDSTISPGFPIVDWTWDFGDGNVVQGNGSPCHTFSNAINPNNRCFNITLIAENSAGCTTIRTKNNFICFTPEPIVNFNADNRILCSPPFTVSFFDSSVSSNGLFYLWKFGDGDSSTLKNPIHTYQNTGNYDVTLTVVDTVCNDTSTQTRNSFIRANIVEARGVITNDTICLGTPTQFIDSSLGAPNSWLWNFGDNTTSTLKNPTHTYTSAGNFNVSLTISTALGCTDDTIFTTSVVVLPTPTANITSNSNNSCQAPFLVNFNSNASPDAISYLWNFGDGNTSTGINPSNNYQAPGNFTVRLIVNNAFGCPDTFIRSNFIQIAPTVVSFIPDSLGGCAPLNMCFRDVTTSLDPIVSRVWNFNDPISGANNTSTLTNPCHLFQNVGSYNVTLTVTTQGGCVASSTQIIGAGNPPVPGLTVSDTVVCSGIPVQFNNTSTGVPPPNNFLWNFGGSGSASTPNAFFAWDDPGPYIVTLSVGNNGCKSDTTVLITVLDPKPDFTFVVNCNIPGRVTFTNASTNANSNLWDFGDGSPTSSAVNPVHTYAAPGTYQVRLVVSNNSTGCTAEIIKTVRILNVQPSFTANPVNGCAPLQVNFTNTTQGAGLTYSWSFGPPGATSTQTNPSFTYSSQGAFTVTLRATDANGCVSTETKTNFIRVSDVTPNFAANTTFACLPKSGNPTPVINFTDQSVTTAGTNIVSWAWNFGNGTTLNFSLPGNPPPASIPVAYGTVGQFTVTLTVTTDLGCTRTATKNQYIRIRQPLANFSTDFNLYCPNQDIPFNNTSTGASLTYLWNFGDSNAPNGGSSTQRFPTYAYQDTGTYTVQLIVTDISGCRDTLAKPNIFTVGKPELNFTTIDTFRFCPPFLVNFTNLSSFDTINFNRIEWDFGDGTGAVNVLNPSHIYNVSGDFAVKVVVDFENGCTDSLAIQNLIEIGGARANMTLSADSACIGDCLLLQANATGAIGFFWLFGDGFFSAGEDSITHCFLTPGEFVPAVVLSDTQQPTCSFTLFYPDTLIVDSVKTLFFTNVLDTACAFQPVQFFDSSSAFIIDEIVRWEWDFGDGFSDTLQNPIHAFANPGLNIVTLTSYNSIGCFNTFFREIWIVDAPKADFLMSDTLGCDSLSVLLTDASVRGDFPIISWEWDFGDPRVNNDTSDFVGPHTYNFDTLGSFFPTLIVTDSFGCKDTSIHQIDIFPVPPGIAGADTITICFGDSVRLEGALGFAAYDWTPGIYLSDSTIAQPMAIAVDTITYELITTDFSSCQSIDSITLIVLPLPTLTISPFPDTNICLFDTIQLFAFGAQEYAWTPAIEISDTTAQNPFVFPQFSRFYTVVTTDSFGCKNADSVRIIINRFNPAFAGERSCLGSPADFVSISSSSDRIITDYFWDFGDTTTLADTSLGRVTNYIYPDSGIYLVTLTVFDSIGCFDTITQLVSVDFPPDAFAETDTQICFGTSLQLFSGGAVDTIFWSPATGLDNPFTFNPTATPFESTLYTAHVTNGVCPFDTASVFIIVKPLPEINTLEDRTINKGFTIQLETESDLFNLINWVTTDTTISCINCLSPSVTPLTTTLYTVFATDEMGCIGVDSVLIAVNEICNKDIVFVPSAFTPNGDGANDFLYARFFGAQKLNYFRVFDRWGTLLFETEDPLIGWDGTNKEGKKLITGVYVYSLEALCFNGEKVIKSGNVTLLK